MNREIFLQFQWKYFFFCHMRAGSSKSFLIAAISPWSGRWEGLCIHGYTEANVIPGDAGWVLCQGQMVCKDQQGATAEKEAKYVLYLASLK